MSTNLQIAQYLRGVPSFAGVYDNAPPAPEHFRWGDVIICNTFGENNRGVGHWIAMRMPVPHKQQLCQFFDPYGFQADDFPGTVLKGVTTDFHEWCQNASRLAGQDGDYRSNDVELECTESQVCGHLCCYFAKHGLPARVDGSINPPWQQVVRTMRDSGCDIGDRLVTNLVKL